MRPEIERIVEKLIAQNDSVIHLDDIGSAIGATRIGQDEIDELLSRLERAGKRIGGPTPKVRQHLRLVLEQARRLKHQDAATPNVTAIAEAAKLTEAEVRAALLYASVMGR